MSTTPDVRVRRVYDKANDQDGVRVLVDHIWPRGVSKAEAALSEWCKDVAPSTELRRWYSHDRPSSRSSLDVTVPGLKIPSGLRRCNTCESWPPDTG